MDTLLQPVGKLVLVLPRLQIEALGNAIHFDHQTVFSGINERDGERSAFETKRETAARPAKSCVISSNAADPFRWPLSRFRRKGRHESRQTQKERRSHDNKPSNRPRPPARNDGQFVTSSGCVRSIPALHFVVETHFDCRRRLPASRQDTFMTRTPCVNDAAPNNNHMTQRATLREMEQHREK